jgi:hypothetical protein
MFNKGPDTREATTTMASRSNPGVHTRSSLGLLANLTFLLALPTAFGLQILFGSGGGTTIHFALAAGCVLLAFSIFDFELPVWMNWVGCASALALGAVFLLQALALLIPDGSLYHLAYPVLGQGLETWLADLIILWLIAMLLIDSRGKTRILGFVAMSLAVSFEVYGHLTAYLGTPITAEAGSMKLLLLLPFVWLLIESTKKLPRKVS